MFETTLRSALNPWDLEISTEQLKLLLSHYDALVESNRSVNLTRITDPKEAAIKHYADSLSLMLWSRRFHSGAATVLDLGTGAGFPAVPLAVLNPDWQVTAIESTGKKVEFLQKFISNQGLKNLTVEHAHSAHWKPARLFDLVVFRALAQLEGAIKEGRRFLAPQGSLIAYQTRTSSSLFEKIQMSAAQLRLGVHEPFEYELQAGSEIIRRSLLVFQRAAAHR